MNRYYTVSRRARARKAGTWVHMPAGLRHSIQAKAPLALLLLLVK